MDANDLIFYREPETGNIQAGGFSIESFLMKHNMPVMKTLNVFNKFGGDDGETEDPDKKVSTIFTDLAVPVGLFNVSSQMKGSSSSVSDIYENIGGGGVEHKVIPDDLFDKLYGLVNANKQRTPSKTRRSKKEGKRKQTRRNK